MSTKVRGLVAWSTPTQDWTLGTAIGYTRRGREGYSVLVSGVLSPETHSW